MSAIPTSASRKPIVKTLKPKKGTLTRPRTKKAVIPLEFDEQATFVKWLKFKGIKHASIANENNMSKLNKKTAIIQGGKAKKTGMQKGFPDLQVFVNDRILFIEMKRQSKALSTVSREQKQWVEYLDTLPYAEATVAYGAKEAIEFVEKHL